MTDNSIAPRKLPSQKRARTTVAKVLDGTRQILKEQGADFITTRNISRITGISPGSIYQYFGNKEQILFTLYDEKLKQTVEAVRSIIITEYLDLPLQEFWVKFRQTLADEGWGDRENRELNKAIAENPLLQEAVENTLDDLYDCLVKFMRHYGSTWSDAELHHLAEYSFGINHFGYTLRNYQPPDLASRTLALTNELEYYLICKAINEPPPDQQLYDHVNARYSE